MKKINSRGRYLYLITTIMVLFIAFMALGSDSDAATVTVTDATGNRLTLARQPQRIACLYAFCGHVVTMLGRAEDMVAIVNGLKKDLLLHQLVPGIKDLPVPSKGGIINIEALMKTGADIVFLKPETAGITAEIKKLERFNLPYFVAGYHSMEEQMGIIENIGKAIGCPEKALAYTRYYRQMIRRVTDRTAHIPPERRVRLYHSVNEPGRTDAPGTIEADWTTACGVTNVSLGSALHGKGNKNFAGIEQIILWDPEVIIVNEEGVDQWIMTAKKWSAIQAVRNSRVFAIPVGISRWGHPGGLETPLAILWTAKKVYPDLFQDIDLKKEVIAFYKTFFDLNLDEDLLEKILGNTGMRQTSS
jgi:iron complex transport system substrate-binding protein